MTKPLGTARIRYTMPRWRILYAADRSELIRFALAELQKAVQDRMPYVLEVSASGDEAPSRSLARTLVAGCPSDDNLVARLLRERNLTIPAKPESYIIACFKHDIGSEGATILIAARDGKGLANGVFDFCAFRLGVDAVADDPVEMPNSLDGVPLVTTMESPAVENRGIWTWGYVIYDYRRFIDNMARLRMNMLTIWNDVPPENIAAVVAHAHDRGIRVILGFHWGWGFEHLDLSSPADRKEIEDHVADTYAARYAHIPHDGIYFQTLTETHDRLIGGKPRALFVRDLVNATGRRLLDKYPGLYIQFGVHAMSILDDYPFFRDIDERIDMVWENAGVIPYNYAAVDRYPANMDPGTLAKGLDTLEKTIDYSRKLADLRPGRGLSLVPKGGIGLRWRTEFENHGRFILGERSERFIRARLAERQPYWDTVNGHWMRNYEAARRFYRELRRHSACAMTATALIEDGLFEARIQPSVALHADILWNAERDPRDYPLRAHSGYYRLFDL